MTTIITYYKNNALSSSSWAIFYETEDYIIPIVQYKSTNYESNFLKCQNKLIAFLH